MISPEKINKYVMLFIVIFIIMLSTSEKPLEHNIIITFMVIIAYMCVEQYFILSKSYGEKCENCKVSDTEGFENLDDEIDESPHDLNAEYLNYQSDDTLNGEKRIENGNIFKMAIGNQNLIKPYLENAKKYYDKIHARSVNTATGDELLNSEMKYSDLNYIVPLNAGMVNPTMTMVAPQNWYPIQPVPPVCVSANKTTTQPLSVVNNFMPFASLQDFNRARRFSGNMNINIDYIKNVLNDPDAGNKSFSLLD